MAVQSCTVTIDGEERRYEKGTTYKEIAEEYQPQYDHRIVLVFVDQLRLQELTKNRTERLYADICYNSG